MLMSVVECPYHNKKVQNAQKIDRTFVDYLMKYRRK